MWSYIFRLRDKQTIPRAVCSPLGERRGGTVEQPKNGTVKFYNGVKPKRGLLLLQRFPFWCNEMEKFYDDDCKVLDKAERSGVADPNAERHDLAIIIKWNGLPFTSQNTCVIIPRRANVPTL